MRGPTPLRIGLAATLALALAGCAGGFPEQSRDRNSCVGYFLQYDQLVRLNPPQFENGDRAVGVFSDRVSQLVVLLIQNDCLTRSRDLTGLEAVAEARGGRPITDSGAPLPQPVAVQVGMLTGDANAARAVAFFSGLGLRATTEGEERLGVRVYVGMVRTEGALAEIIALAQEAGFVAPYASRTFRF